MDKSFDDTLGLLREIWEEVLETEVDDPDENFFDCGGDSLLALVVARQAIEAGLPMPRSGVLRQPTLRGLAAAVLDPDRFENLDPAASA